MNYASRVAVAGMFVSALCAGVLQAEEMKSEKAQKIMPVMVSMFEAYDVNKDGVIEEVEMVKVRAADFAKLDTNKDGKLSKDETAGMAMLYIVKIDKDTFTAEEFAAEFVAEGAAAPTAEQIKLAMASFSDASKPAGGFIKYDLDADGKVTPAEFCAYFIAVHSGHGTNSKAARLESLKNKYHVKMDEDKDGLVSLEEFTGKIPAAK